MKTAFLHLIFTLCLISGASVDGYLGRRVLVKFKYNPEYKQKPKSFCKGSWPDCSELIKTEAKNMWVTSGRFSLLDDTNSEALWVMIRELTGRDTGTYGWGVSRDEQMNSYTLVELNIEKGIVNAREVIAYAGTRGNIKCRYEDQYKDKPKSFLKIETNQWSVKHVSIEANSEWSHDGRFSIHDNRSAGFFSVFIRELITEDTGTYACGVAASDETEIYTLLKLYVTQGFSASIVIALCACLLVLLTVIIFTIVILVKRCKIQAALSSEINGGFDLQSGQMTNPPDSVYQYLESDTNQSVYLRLNPTSKQSVYSVPTKILNSRTDPSDAVRD